MGDVVMMILKVFKKKVLKKFVEYLKYEEMIIVVIKELKE